MNTGLFLEMLDIDSTSGKEAGFADFLAERLLTPACKVEEYEVGDGTKNLFFSWGEPKVVFCTHLDTVPPYISPTVSEEGGTVFHGRGTCDAKGQIFAMYEACKALEAKGYEGFGLLLLAGEETGSFGAKAFREQHPGAEWVIVGEPTDNCMSSASKGTKAFEVTFEGKAFHSGYPQYGLSAVEMFNDFMNALRSIGFPQDEVLGDTTWNVGKLVSDNPQNILSDRLTCRVYFRTTFESDEMVSSIMKNIAGPQAKLRFGRPKVQNGSDVVAKEVAMWQRMMTVTSLRISRALFTIPHPCCARSVHALRLSPPCMARIRISSATIMPLSVSMTTYLMCLNASSLSIRSSILRTLVKLSVQR